MQRNSSTQLLTSSIFLFLLCLTTLLQQASAQTVLAGLTSNGGPDGKGSAFTISTNGSNFSLIQSFADWGKTPTGSLMQASDGKFFGTTSAGTTSYGTILNWLWSQMYDGLKNTNNILYLYNT